MGARYFDANSIFALSTRQSDYTTPVTPDDDPKNYRWVSTLGYDKPLFDSPNIPNVGESNGLTQPDETNKGEDTTSWSSSEQLTFQLAVMRFADALGVVSSVTNVASKVWTHSITPFDAASGTTLPTRSLAAKIGEPASASNKIYDALLPSMMASRIALTNEGGNERPGLVLNTEWLGSGEFKEDYSAVLGSGVKFYGSGKHVWHKDDIAAAHKTQISKKSADITIFPSQDFSGNPVTTECILGDWSQNLDNQLTVNYNCGRKQDDDGAKGDIGGSCESAGQVLGFNFSAIADSDLLQTIDLFERIKTGLPFSVLIGFKGGQIATTTPFTVTVGTGGAAQYATSIPVTALSAPIAKNAVLTFTGGKKVRLSAAAASGATSISVYAIAAAVVAGNTATYSYEHNMVVKLPKLSIATHGFTPVLGKQGVSITGAPLASGGTPAYSVDITTNVEDPATYIAA